MAENFINWSWYSHGMRPNEVTFSTQSFLWLTYFFHKCCSIWIPLVKKSRYDITIWTFQADLINIQGAYNSFQIFFVWAFKIVVDSWEFTMLLLYILWDDWPILMISGSNELIQQELEYILLKPDCHSWWFSKMQSDTLEERYVIKFCFKLGKNATEMYGMLQTAFGASCMNQASVFEWHKRFKEARESIIVYNYYYIIFQHMHLFFEFLISVINHYHIYLLSHGSHVYWVIQYI